MEAKMEGGSDSVSAIISRALPGRMELSCISVDGVLPNRFEITQLAMAAIIQAAENGVVNAVRLGKILERIAEDPSLMIYDDIVTITMATTA